MPIPTTTDHQDGDTLAISLMKINMKVGGNVSLGDNANRSARKIQAALATGGGGGGGIGIVDGSEAAPGMVGEFGISVTRFYPTDFQDVADQTKPVSILTLPPGDWQSWGYVSFLWPHAYFQIPGEFWNGTPLSNPAWGFVRLFVSGGFFPPAGNDINTHPSSVNIANPGQGTTSSSFTEFPVPTLRTNLTTPYTYNVNLQVVFHDPSPPSLANPPTGMPTVTITMCARRMR